MEGRSGLALVAVLTNPPVTDGQRTLTRVALAAELLGFADVRVVNLFSIPSHATGAINELGATAVGLTSAQASLEDGLLGAGGVLLGYGATAPTGPARIHFREQFLRVRTRIDELGPPSWQVGDGPRHPSRWQRWTNRAHPGVRFVEAVRRSLVRVPDQCVGPAN